MNCERAQEYLSDLAEGSLARPLERDLASHVERCDRCAPLFAALREVVAASRALPVAEPPADLTERILARTLPALRELESPRTYSEAAAVRPAPAWQPGSWSWLGIAATILLLLAWRPPEILSELSREASQGAYQVYSFGVQTYQETERWVQDLDVLRMTVGVAFEDRLDHLTERLKDLDEARRRDADDETEDESSSWRERLPVLAQAAAPTERPEAERARPRRHPVRESDQDNERAIAELRPKGGPLGRTEPADSRRKRAISRSLT